MVGYVCGVPAVACAAQNCELLFVAAAECERVGVLGGEVGGMVWLASVAGAGVAVALAPCCDDLGSFALFAVFACGCFGGDALAVLALG